MDFFELINDEVFNPDKFEINEIIRENEINQIIIKNGNEINQNNNDIDTSSRQRGENQNNEAIDEIEQNEEENNIYENDEDDEDYDEI